MELENKNEEQEFKYVERAKKSKWRKPVKVPLNYDEIDKWKMPEISKEQIKGPFLEESSFATLFPKYREKYIREVFGFIQKGLQEVGVKAELDLLEGSMTVKTTKKTYDPYVIIKARDIIKLLARSVPYEACLRLLSDETYCDIIKIKSLVPQKEKFVKRRQRLIGPNGSTIRALEILTDCYIMVQGHTVSIIGHYKKLKLVRRIIEECMGKVHPVQYIKELMIRKELEKDPKLQNENWDRFLPKFEKQSKPLMKKKKIKKEKKERNTFPNPQPMRKIDYQIQSGEYFLSEKQKQVKDNHEKNEKKKEKMKQKMEQRAEQYKEPDFKPKKKQAQVEENKNDNLKEIVERFKVDVKKSLIQIN